MRTGPVSFGVGGGGRGWSLLLKYFLHYLHENQVVLSEYDLIFRPNMAIWQILQVAPVSYTYV